MSRGIDPVALNFRSCSGPLNRKARFYHSGDTEELTWVIRRLRAEMPGAPLGVAGYSLGGNVLLRFLGEQAGDASREVDAAAAISVPYDLSRGTRVLEGTRTGRLYMRFFLKSLLVKARAKADLLEDRIDFDRLERARTLRDFDDTLTAPLHGFGDADTYYRECSSAPVLDRIRVPTLLLQARDDPFQPPECVPDETVRENPYLLAGFPSRGGHVGFLERSLPTRPAFWGESEAARYLARILLDRGADSDLSCGSRPTVYPASRSP